MKNKPKHGGARSGSGRHAAPYKTKVLSVRVRVEWYDDLKRLITKFLNSKK